MKKKFLSLVALFFIIYSALFINHSKADWVQASIGLGYNTVIRSCGINGNNIFAGTYDINK